MSEREARANEEAGVQQRRPIALWIARPIGLGCLAVIICSTTWLWATSYPFELLTHFQWQYFLASLVALVLLLLLRRKWLSILALIAVIAPGVTLLPFSPLARGGTRSAVAAEPGESLRIFHANVLTHNRRADDLIAQITAFDPDLIVLQEVDRWWVEAMAELSATYPHRLADPRGDNFGLLVLSRVALEGGTVEQSAAAHVPSVFGTITFANRTARLAATHPLPPMRAETQAVRDRQLESIIDRLAPSDDPLILVGDLNTTPWSPIYRLLTTKLRLHNAREGRGLYPTWPADLPAIFRIPIDHALATDHFEITHFEVGEEFGSDHLPLLVELRWRNATAPEAD